MRKLMTLAAILAVAAIGCGDKDVDTSEEDTTADTGSADTGTPDTAAPDTGPPDTGTPDTGENGSDFKITCDPAEAAFGGTVIAQAGLNFDLQSLLCDVVTGAPSSDKLVIDDFGGSFGGSGSSVTVQSISQGSFENKSGFYLLDGLPPDTDIDLVLADGDQVVTVSFNIISGSPARLRVNFVLVSKP